MEPQRHWSWVWIVFMLGACAVVGWNTVAKIRHVEYLSTIGADSDNTGVPARSSAQSAPELTPGNALPLPDQLTASYHWLAQTQRMLNRSEARVRHIDYENAPFGRAVLAPSPYRWWLGFLAWCEHVATGTPSSALVEKAALWADPILWGCLVVGFVILTAKAFGPLSAAVVSIAIVTVFPFITGFWPGEPDDRGLAEALAIASVLSLAIGALAPAEKENTRRRWFIFEGVSGTLGLWVKVPVELPVLLGIFCSALWLSFRTSGESSEKRPEPVLPWRLWSYAGAAATVIASLIEYTPSELKACELSFIHPLHGLAWLGAGELLAQVNHWRRRRALPSGAKAIVRIILSVAAIAVVPVLLFKQHGAAFFVLDGMSSHLTRRADGIVARNLAAWLGIHGPSMWLLLTLAPLGVLCLAISVLRNDAIARSVRAAVAMTLGPVVVAALIACAKLSWFQTLDALLLVTLAAALAGISPAPIAPKARMSWIAFTLVILTPGLVYVLSADRPNKGNALNRTEVQDLVLRDLAGWINQHSDPGSATVLAPPSASTALSYYGAFRGIGALSEENKDGIAAAIRIMSSRSVAEAKEIMNRRNITHLVLLSWDTFFDDCARAATGKLEGTFRDHLNFNTLPPWLRPLAYPLPNIPGFEDESVTVLAVVDDQDEATALSNLALYFLERGEMDQARAAAAGLSHFPIAVGAWVARAQVAAATGDDAELGRALKVLQSRLAARVQPLIAWNLRVDLAVVLARAQLETLAKKQLELCVDQIDDEKIRSLSPGSVYRLLVMCRGFDVGLPPEQRALAVSLVPSGLRARLK